jgi:hypothetical protein
MLYGTKAAICSEINTKHIKMQCGQNAKFLNLLANHVIDRLLLKVNGGIKSHRAAQPTEIFYWGL